MILSSGDHEHAAATVQGNLNDHVSRGTEAEDGQCPTAPKLATGQGPVADDPGTEQGGRFDILEPVGDLIGVRLGDDGILGITAIRVIARE